MTFSTTDVLPVLLISKLLKIFSSIYRFFNCSTLTTSDHNVSFFSCVCEFISHGLFVIVLLTIKLKGPIWLPHHCFAILLKRYKCLLLIFQTKFKLLPIFYHVICYHLSITHIFSCHHQLNSQQEFCAT